MFLRAIAGVLLCVLIFAGNARAQSEQSALHTEIESKRKPAAYSCGTIRKLIEMFGEARVIAEARAMGISDDRIASTKRKCLGDR